MLIAWLNANPNPNFGGTELHTLQMIKELSKRKVPLVLLCAEGSYVDRNAPKGIEKFYLTIGNSLALYNTLKLYQLLKHIKPYVLVANNGKEYPNALLAGKLASVRVAFFRHMERMKNPLVRRFVFPYVDMFFAVSDHVRQKLIQEGVKPDKVRVIYNPVDEERFYYKPKEENSIRILFVGKLDEGKGIFDLLEAFRLLMTERKDVTLVYVGDGKHKESLFQRIHSLGLTQKVKLVGYTHNVEDYYRNAHVVVIPSKYTEAFPRVALEALACGCALVASDVGGTKEAIIEGKNGFVFRAGDIEDLLLKLKLAIENWKSFSQASLELYRNKFSTDRVIDNFLGALQSLSKVI